MAKNILLFIIWIHCAIRLDTHGDSNWHYCDGTWCRIHTSRHEFVNCRILIRKRPDTMFIYLFRKIDSFQIIPVVRSRTIDGLYGDKGRNLVKLSSWLFDLFHSRSAISINSPPR